MEEGSSCGASLGVPIGLWSVGLGLVASEPEGPIENPLRWLSCVDSFESEVGRVDVASEELGLENSAPGEIDCDRALP